MNFDRRKVNGARTMRRGLAILLALMLNFSVWVWDIPFVKAEAPASTEESVPPEPTTEPTPAPTVEPTSSPTPEATPEPTPVPEATATPTPGLIPEGVPQAEDMAPLDFEPFAQGDGSESDPYGISTPEQLNAVRDYPDAHFILLNDIDMSEATSVGGAFWNDGAGWEQLCPSSDPFLGSFNGNDKKISGLKVLFNYIGYDTESEKTGYIFNLFVTGILASTNDGIIEEIYASEKIAGTNKGIIENACTSGSISGGSIGGIVNMNYGLITKCVNGINVNASHNAAGIAATNLGIISGCYNTGGIHGEIGSAGIVYMNYGTVENCFNAGYVVDRNGVGGIVERNEYILRNCYNIGGLDSSVVIPGAIAQENNGTVEDCFFLDTVENGICTGTGIATNVVALSELQMLEAASYTGFDFEAIWSIEDQANYPYPQIIDNSYTIGENHGEFEGGCGLPANPYKISSPVQLNGMRNYPGSWFEIINDIDMSGPTHEGGEFYSDGEGWIPVGDYFLSFMGGLNGNGHIIKGIYINSADDYWNNGTGLFGNLAASARISNLSMAASDISGHEKTGSIAGFNSGTIQDCYSSGMIKGDYAGGIVSSNSGSIYNCYNIATVCGWATGGCAAYNYGLIEYGYNIGAVGSYQGYAGAITYQNYGTISHMRYLDTSIYGIVSEAGSSTDVIPLNEQNMCSEASFEGFDFDSVWTMSGEPSYPYPELYATSQFIVQEDSTEFEGGAGYPFSPYIIKTAEQLNDIRLYPGGIYSLQKDIDLTEATKEGGPYYNGGAGWVPIDNFTGGFMGNDHVIIGLTIDRPEEYNVGLFSNTLKGSTYIKDLILQNVNITAAQNVGALAGNNGAYLKGVFTYGVVTAGVTHNSGGIVGRNFGAIELSGNACIVSGAYAGGISGVSVGNIEMCSNSGTITGLSDTGGIVGDAECSISDCYNLGEIRHIAGYTGYIGVGGIAGNIKNSNITNCYNAGFVHISNGSGYVGGIAGTEAPQEPDSNEIANCYFTDTNQKEIGNSENSGTPSTLISLKKASTFGGFDFVNVWMIDEEKSTPYFKESFTLYPMWLTLDTDSEPLFIGNNAILLAKAGPNNAIDSNLKWTSNNSSIAIVNQEGLVTAIGEGETIIKVETTNGMFASCNITVEKIYVASVKLNTSSQTIIQHDNFQLEATVSPSNATYPEVSWSSDDESVVTVNQNGLVSAFGVGTATITATADGQSDTCTVTVVHATIQSSHYTIDRTTSLLKGVADGTTVTALKANLDNESELVKVYGAGGQEVTTGVVGTGMTIKYSVGGVLKDSLDIFVMGDISGDGKISVADYTLLRLDILGLKDLSGLYAAAGDVNGDGGRDVSDYTLIRLDLLGIQKIN